MVTHGDTWQEHEAAWVEYREAKKGGLALREQHGSQRAAAKATTKLPDAVRRGEYYRSRGADT